MMMMMMILTHINIYRKTSNNGRVSNKRRGFGADVLINAGLH